MQRDDGCQLIRWGVIGCGGIADRRTIPEGIIPARDSELIAVTSRSDATSRRIAEKYHVKRYASQDDLLRDPMVDAVYIATPNYLHAEECIAAAEQGKHVFCEKPLALTVEGCKEVVRRCERNHVKLQVGFMMRFHACHKEAAKMIEQGRIGRPVMGRAELTCWYPEIKGAWRQDPKQAGGGCLMDMGIHCIDLLRTFLGEVEEVFAFTDRVTFGYPVEDTSVVNLFFDSRACGIVDNFFDIPDDASQNRLEIYGTRGCILADGTIGQNSTGKLRMYTQGEEKGYEASQSRESIGVGIGEITPAPTNIFKEEIEHFVDCIREDKEPINSGYEAIKDQMIVMAAYESSRTGKRVKLGPR